MSGVVAAGGGAGDTGVGASATGGDGAIGGARLEGEKVKVLLRDCNEAMVSAWRQQQAFGDSSYKDLVEISLGDIFNRAPAADAIVSPANSFGFMDGGIDMVYSNHFGWQMQKRLQKLLQEEYDGELPVGCAVVLPAYPPEQDLEKLSLKANEGRPIRYLVSAPTMRIPTNVDKTVNAYLAFRAVLRAGKIRSILCPGLGTAVGQMPVMKCAIQMRVAYQAVMFGSVPPINHPTHLSQCYTHHVNLYRGIGEDT